MKKILWLTGLILWPALAIAQSNLYFPRSFTLQDRQSTGFAIMNPGATDATVEFTLYAADGAVLATANRTVPRGGQDAKLGSELFPSATAAGWVQATSGSTGLQGLWFGGDFVNLTRGDGAISARPSTDQVFPYIPPALSELNIANPNTSPITVTLKGFDDAGAGVGQSNLIIPPRAIMQVDIRTIVQSGTLAYARITATAPFVSLLVLRGTASLDNAVQNGIDASAGSATATTLVFPHFLDGTFGGSTYNSVISVVNLSNAMITVHLQFVEEAGGAPVESQDYIVGPQGTVRGLGSDFFPYPVFGFHNGHVKVTATGPIGGAVDYGTAGDGEAIVPAQVTPQTALFFPHIADADPWYTGIALENPSSSSATVEIFAMNANGGLLGGAANVPTARFTLGTGQKVAKLLHEFIPQAQTNGGFVYIRTTNGVPIHAIQLVLTRNLKILANISGVTLPAGVVYSPPNP
jgi:hypothetical protein